MHSPSERTKRSLSSILYSLLLHSSLLALALFLANSSRPRIVPPATHPTLALLEDAGTSHAIPVPLPPSTFAAHNRTPTRELDTTRKTLLPVPPTPQKMSGGGTPPKPHAGDGSSTALSGNGSDSEDARPAFPIFSPRPPVTDRALLPAIEAKVVVDVDVDALGQVTHETLVHGVNAQLNQLCLDAVRNWRFHPATVDGKPVPSQAELIFPFNKDYPIATS
ncbi:MAG TPA: TonB family protein [Terracidiphilus sp.]|nr:TonB family protein [Terracidiphilus sp.]